MIPLTSRWYNTMNAGSIQKSIYGMLPVGIYHSWFHIVLGIWYIYTVHVNVCVSVRGRPGIGWDKRQEQSLEVSGRVGWQQACVRVGFWGLKSIRYMYNSCVLNKGNYLYFRIHSISFQSSLYNIKIHDRDHPEGIVIWIRSWSTNIAANFKVN